MCVTKQISQTRETLAARVNVDKYESYTFREVKQRTPGYPVQLEPVVFLFQKQLTSGKITDTFRKHSLSFDQMHYLSDSVYFSQEHVCKYVRITCVTRKLRLFYFHTALILALEILRESSFISLQIYITILAYF